jgi:ribonuclease P protein component
LVNQTLRKNNEFRKVFSAGGKKIGKYVIVYLLPVKKKSTRVGIIAKKSIGNAVKRNKIKRILRELWRNRCFQLLSGYDVVILARKKIIQARFSDIEDELMKLIKS